MDDDIFVCVNCGRVLRPTQWVRLAALPEGVLDKVVLCTRFSDKLNGVLEREGALCLGCAEKWGTLAAILEGAIHLMRESYVWIFRKLPARLHGARDTQGNLIERDQREIAVDLALLWVLGAEFAAWAAALSFVQAMREAEGFERWQEVAHLAKSCSKEARGRVSAVCFL